MEKVLARMEFIQMAVDDLGLKFEKVKKDPETRRFVFSEVQKERIVSLDRSGENMTAIAIRFGVSRHTIKRLLNDIKR